MKQKIKIAIGFIISVALLYFLYSVIDFQLFLESLKSANYLYVMLGITVYLLAYFANTKRWQIILLANGFQHVPFYQIYKIVTMSYMLNMLLPAKVGEVSKAYFLVKKVKTPLGIAVATVVTERFFDMVTVALFLVIPLFILDLFDSIRVTFPDLIEGLGDRLIQSFPSLKDSVSSLKTMDFTHFIEIPLYIYVSAIALGFVIILIFRKNYSLLVRIIQKLMFWMPDDHQFFQRIHRFFSQLKFFSHPKELLEILFFSVLIWGLYLMSFYAFLQAFHVDIQVIHITFIIGVSAIMVAVPSAPGGLGPFEIGFTVATVLVLGLKWESHFVSVVSTAIVLHVSHMLSISVIGLYHFIKSNISLKDLKEDKAA
ncbi:MAG: flippase-like domain-containing protein [Spirochaetota bacterium]|nr:flippase-like domain-containing protein [Spirochaetota bacterium]